MTAEIIAIGSELLTPQRVDTNSLFLTDQLKGLGVEVVTKSVIGDDLNRLADAVRRAVSRSEIVILCGGLGPTEDDLTRDAVAAALDRKLTYHPEIPEVLEQRFAQLKRKMVEVNKRQAFLVEGAEILPNDRGTAPGQWIEESGSRVMLLPGPPHEMKAMFTRQCLPRLARIVPRQVIRTLVLRVSGMPESDLDQLIAPVYKKYDNPTTTILAAAGDLQIHLRARCSTEGEAAALLVEVGGPIELLLGDRIYSKLLAQGIVTDHTVESFRQVGEPSEPRFFAGRHGPRCESICLRFVCYLLWIFSTPPSRCAWTCSTGPSFAKPKYSRLRSGALPGWCSLFGDWACWQSGYTRQWTFRCRRRP